MTVREQLEAKYGTPSNQGLSVRARLEAKYNTPKEPSSFTFDVQKTPEQKTTEEKTRKANIFAGAEQAKKESDKANSVLGSTKNFIEGAGKTLFSSTFGLGESAVKAFGNQARGTGENITKLGDSNLQLLKAIREKKAKGGDTSNLERAYNENQKLIDTFKTGLDTEQKAIPTNLQVAGQGLGTAVDVLGFATLPGKATAGMKAGSIAKARPAILPKGQSNFFTKQTAKEVGTGAGFGYGYDVGQNLQEGKTGMDIAKPGIATGIGAGIPIIGRGLPAMGKSIKETVKPTEQVFKKNIDKLEQVYTDIASGTTLGKKKVAKLGQKTEALNRAGTEGKTPMRTLAEEGIFPEREGTKINSFDQAQQYKTKITPLRKANKKALVETGLSTQPIKLNDLEQEAISFAKTPENINAGRFEKMSRDITDEFDILRRAYPEGEIPLTIVDDIKSARWDNVFKNKSLIEADVLKKDSEYAIAKALQKNIEKTVTKAGNPQVAQLNREIGDRLEAAKFLEDLHGKTLKGGRLMKYVTTMLGATMGGNMVTRIIGAIGGNAVGDLIIATNLGSPKMRFILNKLKTKDPEAYTKTIQWLYEQQVKRSGMLMLPAPKNRNIINQGRAIPVLPKGEDMAISRQSQLQPYSNENIIAQSKSPASAQTTKAINAHSSKAISKIIPQPKPKSKTIQALEKIKKTPNKQGGFAKNPLASDDLLSQAKKFDNGKDFYQKSGNKVQQMLREKGIRGEEQTVKYWEEITGKKNTSYAMSHRPTKTGANASDISKKGEFIPEDFYEHPEYYANMKDKNYQESFAILKKIKGKPEAEITIYRASPKNELNNGDWVTLSKGYAKQEALTENTPVHSFKVKAKDIQFAGDDINEFGYYPEVNKKSIPIIPKTKK